MTEPLNQMRLSARLVERESLRYTPAGLAICQGVLEHESTQVDAGHDRQVRLTLTARFTGPLAEKVSKEALGSAMHVEGFIAPKRMFRDGKNSASVVLHVATYQQQDN